MNKILSTLVVASGLTGAAFLGGVAVSAVANAQDDAPSTTEPAPDVPAPDEAPPEGAPEEGEGCRGPRGHGADLAAAADAIGISVEDLRSALMDGQTIAEVAEANGVDPQAVVDAMVAEAEEHLAEKVAEGELTQEEADERLADLAERVAEHVNEGNPRPLGPGGPGGPGGPDGPGGHGGPPPGAPGDEAPAQQAPEAEGSSFTF